MFDFFKNLFFNRNRYRTNSEGVIVSCFFNPQNSPYRLLAFQKFYSSIKHLNHRIIECVIGDAKPQLPDSPYITRVYTDSLLWHKEPLLNKLISELPEKFKYVFWIDADVKFCNKNWMVDAVHILKKRKMVQLFEYCVHLDKNQTQPDFDVEYEKTHVLNNGANRSKKLWRGFAANFNSGNTSSSNNYDVHGHVGFAWGARRDVLKRKPLYDRAMIGGADHIIAHAAAGHIPHECIRKSFTDDIKAVEEWMWDFYGVVGGSIGYVPGVVYHYWHGDITKRQYLKRIKDFTEKSKDIVEKDENGLYVKEKDPYMEEYFKNREVNYDYDFCGFDDSFFEEMGYFIQDIIFDVIDGCDCQECDEDVFS